MANGSGLENLTAVLMLQSSGGSVEEGSEVGCCSVALCCAAAAADFWKWSAASSACRENVLLNSFSSCRQHQHAAVGVVKTLESALGGGLLLAAAHSASTSKCTVQHNAMYI